MPTDTRAFEKYDPATGELLARYEVTGPDDVRRTVAKARHALPRWQAVPPRTRAKILKSIADRLYGQADELAAVVSRETGKPLADALEADVGSALGILNYYAENGPRQLRPQRIPPDRVSLLTARSHWQTYQPRGVIAIISPWNYPLAIPASGLAAALMAGNAVVLKPSELTPASARALVEIVRDVLFQADLPADIVQIVLGEGETGAALIDAEIDGVIFTGSDRTGRKIREALSGRGVWSSLELGGSDAMIVLEGCDLEKAASYALWGRFINTGQTCAAVKRLLVPENQRDAMLHHLKRKIEQLKVGAPDAPGSHLGPLISQPQLEQVEAQVQDAVSRGALLVMGGHRLDRPGWFYAPTLLADAPPSARVLTEEVFGPVLPVLAYQTLDEAVEMANATRFGLTASVFGPVDEAHEVAERLAAGTVIINDVGPSNYAMACAPWGGWKSSGSGVSHGQRALHELCQSKIISMNGLFQVPGFDKPLWHFNKQADGTARAHAILALAGNRLDQLLNPKTWLTFWRNRAGRKI